jgi:hypothetical protein
LGIQEPLQYFFIKHIIQYFFIMKNNTPLLQKNEGVDNS